MLSGDEFYDDDATSGIVDPGSVKTGDPAVLGEVPRQAPSDRRTTVYGPDDQVEGPPDAD